MALTNLFLEVTGVRLASQGPCQTSFTLIEHIHVMHLSFPGFKTLI